MPEGLTIYGHLAESKRHTICTKSSRLNQRMKIGTDGCYILSLEIAAVPNQNSRWRRVLGIVQRGSEDPAETQRIAETGSP